MQRSLSRWVPADLARTRFNRVLEDAFGDLFSPVVRGEEVSNRNWLPAVDVAETPDGLSLYAELPGLTREDVDITLENNVLTVRGERKFEKDVKEENFHRIERSYGAFSRSFTLPTNVKSDAVEATFKDGVLTVRIPKAEEAKSRKIAIA
ncbi:MAG TPA: Hsp20/alpha crystallin family protein [Thermoanaerobaculia bacterium]|nr:Hsp20/alpha crystallin family protein [Thermoanaerobaculia bacterium]